MRKLRLPALLAALALFPAAAFAQGTPAPSPSPSASATPEDPAVTARAKDIMHQAQTGHFDRSQMTTQMSAALTDDKVKNVATQLGSLGDPSAFALEKSGTQDGQKVYIYRVSFKDGDLLETVVIDPASNKLSGLWFKPAP